MSQEAAMRDDGIEDDYEFILFAMEKTHLLQFDGRDEERLQALYALKIKKEQEEQDELRS